MKENKTVLKLSQQDKPELSTGQIYMYDAEYYLIIWDGLKEVFRAIDTTTFQTKYLQYGLGHSKFEPYDKGQYITTLEIEV